MLIINRGLSDQEIFDKIRKFFNAKRIKKAKPRYYSELIIEFNELWNYSEKGYRAIINNIDIKRHLRNHFPKKNRFICYQIMNSYLFEEKLSRKIMVRPHAYDRVLKLLYFYEPEEIFKYYMVISTKIVDIYKKYLVGLMHFYNDYPEFNYVFSFYFSDLLDNPFFDYYDKDCRILSYNNNEFTFLYLQLIERIFFANYIVKPPKSIKKAMINVLLDFELNGTKKEADIAYRIRHKIHKYKGSKVPDHFVFWSKIDDDQAKKLAEYIKDRFVVTSVDKKSLYAFFIGRFSTVKESALHYYEDNDFISVPIKIKGKKLGYIAFILDYLYDNGYIGCNHLWKNISYHNYFANHAGKELSANEFARALTDKRINFRIKNDNNKEKDTALEKLDKYLKKHFSN